MTRNALYSENFPELQFRTHNYSPVLCYMYTMKNTTDMNTYIYLFIYTTD